MKRQPKTVWITGASSGIGLAFAKYYAKKGYRLILTARRKERLEQMAGKLGISCRIEPADLSQEAECRRICELLKEETVDIFINNAGFGGCGDFAKMDLDRDLSMIRVNVEAMHILCKEVLRQMRAKGHGTILNVASSAGLLPGGPYMATYYATKAYVVSLTKSIAEEQREKKSGVYVCALCPGPVDTEFNDAAGVEFALPGITASQCVKSAVRGMRLRRTIIVPTLAVCVGASLQRFAPDCILLPVIASRQKAKMGMEALSKPLNILS